MTEPCFDVDMTEDMLDQTCPVRTILGHITSKWGVLILIALKGRTLRFSELRRRVGGISERMLSQTLQTLEADDIVHRKAYDVVPPHVEYSLTQTGDAITDRLVNLVCWIDENLTAFSSVRDHRALQSQHTAQTETAS